MEASTIPQLPTVEIEAWVCTVCGSYHAGSSTAGMNLREQPRTYNPDPNTKLGLSRAEALERFGSRAQCPDCLERGTKTERVLTKIPVRIRGREVLLGAAPLT